MDKSNLDKLYRGNEFRTRVTSGIVITVIMLALPYFGGWVLFLGLLGGLVIGLFEFYRVLNLKGHKSILPAGVLIGATFLIDAKIGTSLMNVGIFVGIVGMILLPRFTKYTALDWIFTFGGAIYIGLLLSYAILIRALPQGFQWLLIVFLSVGITDVTAYIVGSLIGKHKLAPRISPGKTREGFIGGLVFCLLMLVALNLVFHVLNWWLVIAFGLILSVCDLIGDLWASIIKRYTGAKDYGNLIPGHGGLLDRIDGLLVALPVAYWFILLVANSPAR